jgi:uncharacterized protein HemX
LTAVLLAVVFVLGISVYVFAQNPEGTKAPQAMTVEQRKEKMITLIDERIKMLQEAKTCIEAAKTREDFRACRKNFREERRELREEMRERRGMKERRMNKPS